MKNRAARGRGRITEWRETEKNNAVKKRSNERGVKFQIMVHRE